ncbi:MAG: membrane protein insertion efficiency factor YidD [Candidatus Brocadiia bacterium]
MRRLALLVLRAYRRFLSPLLGPRCRFEPTCSAYAIEAIRRKGLLRGSLKALWRLLRCHPYAKGGYDPVEPDDEPAPATTEEPRTEG